MRKVFLDASVIIAGAASSTGASRAVLMLAEVGLFQGVVSTQVLEECQRNLAKKLPTAMAAYSELLSKLNLEVVNNPSAVEYSPWLTIIESKDAPILAAAVLAHVDRLLTLNTRDFTQMLPSNLA
ncbi:MAG: putative toxin-antitoxin system toxin component, PIN family [Nodosilinea sp.]